MNKKLFFYIFNILTISIIIIFSFSLDAFAAYPKLITTILDAFDSIKGYLMAMATPVAAVAIASGFLMQKFSFGDEERIRTAKKMIRGTLFCYGFILVLNLILSAINTLLT